MAKRKLKIVHIEDYFDPNAGYQINELIKYNEKFKHYIICSKDMSPFYKEYSENDDKICEKKYDVKIIRLESRIKYSHRILLKGWLKKVESLTPDVLFMHGIGDFKDLLLWTTKKKRRYKVVRDCHMSWVASQNKLAPIYFFTFKLLFAWFINNTEKYKKIFALGLEEKEYLMKLGIKENKIEIMPHGYDAKQFYFNSEEGKQYRLSNNIPLNSKVICYTGKINKFKKPDLIFDCIKELDLDKNKKYNITLLFVGTHDKDYYDHVFYPKIKDLESKLRIIVKSAVPVEKLRVIYNASDICFWPKETTLSSVHSQACGTNVIMEKQLSNIERVVDQDNLYKIGDLKDAARILIKNLNYSGISHQEIIKGNNKRDYSLIINKLNEVISI